MLQRRRRTMSTIAVLVATVVAGCGVGDDATPGPAITQLPDVTTSTQVEANEAGSDLAGQSTQSEPRVTLGPTATVAAPASTAPTGATATETTVGGSPADISGASTTTVTAPTTTTSTTSTTTTSTTTTSTTTTSTTTTSTTTTEPPVTAVVVEAPTPGAPTTVCTSVALIGDSTAVGIDGSTGVISADDGIVNRLAAIGVSDVRLDISGGRSIIETLPGQVNGTDAITALRSAGFDGCWIVALGTNDAANIAAGSNADAANRVERIISATGGGRVLWINTSTITTAGHWARDNTVRWNNDLASLLAGRGNVGLADWDTLASQNAWFVSDGIHPNSAGLVARSQFFADSLRTFFPA